MTVSDVVRRRQYDNVVAEDMKQSAKRSFSLKKILGIWLIVFLLAACLPQPVPTRQTRGDLAEIHVYFQPVPPEAKRLTWTVDDLAVVLSDGSRIPLNVQSSHLKGSELEGRQTHLAYGFLPQGSYRGISLGISKASLTREDGDAALTVPEDPLEIPLPFELAPSGVLSLFLSLSPEGLVSGGFGFSPSFSLALPPRELKSLIGYLTMPEADRISVFNRKSMQIIGSIATGRKPMGISIDNARGRGYVAVPGDDAVEIIDVFRGDIRERIQLRTGDGARDLTLTQDGQILLSANYGSDTVSIIDPVQAVEVDRVTVGQGPTSVVVNRDGTRAYVTCALSSTLAVIDLSTQTLSATISLEEATPLDAALDRDEEKLFIIGRDSPNLTVVDLTMLAITDRIYIGTGSVSIAVDELSGLVYVSRENSNRVSVVDPSALMPVDTIQLTGAAGHVAIDLQEKALLVIIPDKRILQKVDLVSKRIMGELKLDTTPSEVAVLENR